jgi:hypothetical protein
MNPEQKRRSLRLALMLGALALVFYGGFILMMGLR